MIAPTITRRAAVRRGAGLALAAGVATALPAAIAPQPAAAAPIAAAPIAAPSADPTPTRYATRIAEFFAAHQGHAPDLFDTIAVEGPTVAVKGEGLFLLVHAAERPTYSLLVDSAAPRRAGGLTPVAATGVLLILAAECPAPETETEAAA